jgi:hypothetical protein
MFKTTEKFPIFMICLLAVLFLTDVTAQWATSAIVSIPG